MSDFLTRLVQRQEGAVPMVQPRTPSMFAPPVSGAGEAELQAMDSLPVADASRRTQAPLESGEHQAESLSHVEPQDGPQSVSASRATTRPVVALRRSESFPPSLLPTAAAAVRRPAHESSAALRSDTDLIHESVTHRQMASNKPASIDRVDSASVPRAARSEAPPPVVGTRRTARSSAIAPPSLASGTVTGRRQEQTSKTSNEPPVEVTIGRIEVTAVSATPVTKQKSGPRRAAMALEEYLARRQEGRP